MKPDRKERHYVDTGGPRDYDVYDMIPTAEYWLAVTDVPCPTCEEGMVRWSEAGHVPGHRTCRGCGRQYLAGGTKSDPTLICL